MICKACSKTIDDDSIFCTYCGSKTADEAISSEAPVKDEAISEEKVIADDAPRTALVDDGEYVPEFAYRMKMMGRFLLIGYGIGLALGFAFCFLIKAKPQAFVIEALVFGFIFGTIISAFIMASKGSVNSLASKGLSILKGMFVGLLSSFSPNPVFILILFVKLVFDILLAIGLTLFITVSFPLTVLYTVVMFLIEKFGKEFEDSTIQILDKIVPVVSFIIAAVITIGILKSM